jgi:hypothetical protein
MPIRSQAARCAFLLVPLFAAACESTDPPGPPASLAIVGSTTVSATVGTTAADSLSVKVVDADGRAVSNAQVTWTVEAAPGVATVSPASGTTDRSGIARAALQAGTVAGPATVRAGITASATALSAPFTVTVNPGAPAQLQAAASTTMGTGVSRTVAVTARDQFGNATPTTGLTFTSSNTAVAEVSPAGLVTSKALGAATVTAQAGAASAQTRVWVVPAAINACERNTGTLCSNWALADSVYNATWVQGSRAVIRVGHFSADSVRFTRMDPAGTSAGMTAVYRGPVATGSVQAGTVTWTQNGLSVNGTWTGTW